MKQQHQSLSDLEMEFTELAKDWNDTNNDKTPFCCIEGVKYAINAFKVQSIQEEGLIVITMPFYASLSKVSPLRMRIPMEKSLLFKS